jgi:scyllo-inositol 2-dehydrogenase (NAD+)
VRVGVVGLGRMGHFYADTLASLGGSVTLAAVADPSAEARDAMRTSLGLDHAYAEAGDLLDHVDAVVVATPTSAHAEVVLAAAALKKAIFCEKPLALTVAETRRVLAGVNAAHVLLQVGFMRRFDTAHVEAKQAIADGKIGRPLVFKSAGRDPGCPPVDFADPRHSGGLIIDMGIHDFDMARWLMGSEVERVSAEGSLLFCEELRRVGDIDNAIVNLRFASGALGNVEVSRTACYGYDIQLEVLGTEGAVRLGQTTARGNNEAAVLAAQPATTDSVPPFVRRFANAYRAQIVDFLRCVQEDRTPRATGEDALAAIQIAGAATLAASSGRPVECESTHLPPGSAGGATEVSARG